jgi:hypothetical protein
MSKNYLQIILVMILISAEMVSGAETGKISGKIIDESTGEALVGVNVIIKGTSIGAATDIEGEYFIINVPVGSYSVSASYVGYTKVITENVVVNAGRTTVLNFKLKSESYQQNEIVVAATRPPVEIDRTSSEQIIGDEEINKTFARTLPDILETKAGIFQGYYRGSSITQTAYIVDNVSMNSGLFSDNYTGINTSTIQEISVQTGGYNAEFGNARSAIINVVTKGDAFYSEPNELNSAFISNVHGTVLSRLRPAGKYHFGRNMYSKENYDWTHYDLDYWTGESEDQSSQFYGQDPQSLLDAWQKQITPNDTLGKYTERPEWETEATVYGNILNNMGFLISGRFKRGVNIFPQAIPYNDEYNFQGKFSYAITPSMKLSLNAIVGGWEAVSSLSSNLTSTENSQETQWNGLQQVTDPYQYDKYAILGSTWEYWPEKRNFSQFNLNFTHTISDRTFYELNVGYLTDKSDQSDRYGAVPEDKWGDLDTEYMMVNYFLKKEYMHKYDKNHSKILSFKGDLTSQVTKTLQLKTGAEFKYYDIAFTHCMPYYEGGQRWNLINAFSGNPYEGNVYYQNKLEFEGLIINAGLRFDFFNQNRKTAENMYDPLAYETTTPGHDANEPDGIPGNPNMVDTKLQTAFAPRIGISHPLSENTVLHFFYGHFYQRPSWSKMYGFPFINYTEDMSTVLDPCAHQTTYMDQWQGYYGNPSLSYERTIQYEIGFDQNIENLFLLKVAGYYKDATNEANSWTWLYSASNQYNTPIMINNSNYSDVRGIETSIESRFNFPINFGITHELYWSWSGDVGYWVMYEPISGGTNSPKGLVNDKGAWSDFNKVKAYVDIYFDKNFGPEFLGFKPLSDLRLYFYTWWRQGEPYTYHGPGDISTEPNNMRWFSYYQTNLKIAKGFSIFGTHAEISADITNLFNQKFLNLLYDEDMKIWQENSDKPDSERLPKHWFSNEPNEWSWYSYEVPPRQVYFQFKLDF